jgi:hypothetical protein
MGRSEVDREVDQYQYQLTSLPRSIGNGMMKQYLKQYRSPPFLSLSTWTFRARFPSLRTKGVKG